MVELETIGFEVVCLMVGLTTEVIIVALELEAPGFKGVSDWGVGLELVIDVSGFKEVVGPSVEGFKVVSAIVTGVPVTGVSDVAMSVSWLLLLVVDPNSEVVSLTILKLVVVVVDSEDISGSEMDEAIVSDVETLIEL